MKYTVPILMGLALSLTLSACALTDAMAPSEPTLITEAARPSVTAPLPTQTTLSGRIAGTPMTEEELEPVRQLFESDHSLYSQALTSQFASPRDVNIREFFYNGHMAYRINPEGYVPPTEEELRYFHELYGGSHPIFDMDATVVSAQEIDEDLMAVFGLRLEDTNQNGLDQMRYCPDTHRYFLFKGDTNAQCVHFLSGVWLDESRMELSYLGGFNEPCTAVLELRNGHYYILYNASSMNPDIKPYLT